MVGTCVTAALWAVFAAALFTVFSLLRFSFNLGVVERPLVQGLVWGLVTGDVTFAVSVALVFELFWLDLIPAGTFIPPNAAASTLGTLALCSVFGFHQPADVVFPMLLTLPLAWFAARGEQILRRWQDAGYNALQQWLAQGGGDGYRPGRLVRRAAAQASVAYFLFFMAGVSVLAALVYWLLGMGFLHPPQDMFTWGHLWVTASVGGLLALRVPGGYGVVFCGACVVGAASLFLG